MKVIYSLTAQIRAHTPYIYYRSDQGLLARKETTLKRQVRSNDWKKPVESMLNDLPFYST